MSRSFALRKRVRPERERVHNKQNINFCNQFSSKPSFSISEWQVVIIPVYQKLQPCLHNLKVFNSLASQDFGGWAEWVQVPPSQRVDWGSLGCSLGDKYDLTC